jgi:DNA-binding MarR family transcriptional regulator
MIIDSTRIPVYMAGSTIKALCHLRDVGKCRPTDLATVLGVCSAVVTGVIDRLEQAGHAARVAKPKDRRTVPVEITDAGRLFAEGLRPVAVSEGGAA